MVRIASQNEMHSTMSLHEACVIEDMASLVQTRFYLLTIHLSQ